MSVLAVVALGLVVLGGSSIPFVPTGEVVSASAALASGSLGRVVVIYVVVVAASIIGDTVMLTASRFGSRWEGRRPSWWPRRRRPRRQSVGAAVDRARAGITSHAFTSMVSGRLLPGGRAPVIITLGLARYPVRRFLAIDAVACAVWAALYTSLGAVGGRLTEDPLVGTAIAIGCAVSLGLLAQLTRLLVTRGRRDDPQPDDLAAS